MGNKVSTISVFSTTKDGQDYYGFWDSNNTIQITSAIYDNCSISFSEGFGMVEKNGLFGFVDESGQELTPLVFESIKPFTNGLAWVKKGGLWGVIDFIGRKVIPYQFFDCKSFSKNGFAPVRYSRKQGGWGIVDKTGKLIFNKKGFYNITSFNNSGVAIAKYYGRSCLLTEKGEVVGEKYFTHLRELENERFWGIECGNSAIIDENFEVIVKPQRYFSEIYYKSEGLYQVVDENDLTGYMNELAEEVISCQFIEAYAFSQGLACFKGVNGLYGYIDKNGEQIIPPIFEEAGYFNKGVAPVKRGGIWYYINLRGENIFANIFYSASDFSNGGFAKVEFVKDEYGFIDENGDTIVRFHKGITVESFSSERLTTFSISDQEVGLMSNEWMIICPPIYNEIRISEHSDLHPFRQGDLWGYLSDEGNIIIEPVFIEAGEFSSSDIAVVKFKDTKDNISIKEGLLTREGNIVSLEPIESNTPILEIAGNYSDSSYVPIKLNYADAPMGYLDNNFNICKSVYQFASPFYQGEAIVDFVPQTKVYNSQLIVLEEDIPCTSLKLDQQLWINEIENVG
ncbi:WG repeat-containing protein [Streptococcus hyovaginalis]